MSAPPLANARGDVADYLDALVLVYSLVIIAYIVVNLLLQFGLRPGYASWVDSVLGFLRDVSEPFLRPFRKVIPMLGPLDLSPIVALLLLQLLGSLLANAVRG